MSVGYKKLWKLLIDKDMKKKDLISTWVSAPIPSINSNCGDNVTTDVLARICKSLECNIRDIMDVVEDERKYTD